MKYHFSIIIIILIIIAFLLFSPCFLNANQIDINKEKGFTDLDMVLIEGGRFLMQSEKQIDLTYSFYIGKYEVTFDEWDIYNSTLDKQLEIQDEGWGKKNRPIINVNWYEVINYCNWLSKQKGFPPAYDRKGNLLDEKGNITYDITKVKGFRLPSEAEWEYAARNRGQRSGQEFSGSSIANMVAWYKSNSDLKTHPVGGKKENELNIFDMSGNVWEWCHDTFENIIKDNLINPLGSKSGQFRVIRGGSFNLEKELMKTSYRFFHYPEIRHDYIGFRLARTNSGLVFSP